MRNVVRVMLTMISVMLTCFRGKNIDFQLKMLFGKRVSVFKGGGAQPHAKRNVVCVLLTIPLTMVSVVLTCCRGKYSDFQLKMLFGKRVSVFRGGGHSLMLSAMWYAYCLPYSIFD